MYNLNIKHICCVSGFEPDNTVYTHPLFRTEFLHDTPSVKLSAPNCIKSSVIYDEILLEILSLALLYLDYAAIRV